MHSPPLRQGVNNVKAALKVMNALGLMLCSSAVDPIEISGNPLVDKNFHL